MKMSKEQFKEKLKQSARKQQVELSDTILDNLYSYKELLVEWNEKINLTTIIEDYDVIVKHIVDSLIVVKHIKEGQSIIDVGTGAGLPGMIISIYFEGKVNVTLLDSSNKKITFLKEVIKELNLKNIRTVNSRAEEDCQKKEFREVFDLAIARAVASMSILSEYLSGYVKVDGRCIFMKAGDVEEELNESKNALETMQLIVEKEYRHEIEYLDDKLSRTIIVAKKIKKLDRMYPRNFGRMKKHPL